jgi:hypothetical protein
MAAKILNKVVPTLVALVIVGLIIYAIVAQIRENHLRDDPKLQNIVEHIRPLFQRKDYGGRLAPLNDRNLLGEIDLLEGDHSYTLNKHKVYLCLKDDAGNYYDDNTLVFVMLHELTHCILTDVLDHPPEFREAFHDLLQRAIQMGIYDPSKPIPHDYCNWQEHAKN